MPAERFMDARQRIFWLTVQQAVLVMIGFSLFTAVRLFYQYFVLNPSVGAVQREELRRMLTGQETHSFWTTPVGKVLPWVGLVLIYTVGRNLASQWYRLGREKRQVKRDLRAALLVERLEQGHDEPFSLYLRSFSDEDTFRRRKGFWWYVLLEGDVTTLDRETLELLIAQRMRIRLPMIALGPPGDALGAGRLATSEAEWKDLAVFLMDRARMIFIVPGSSEGVLWEIRHLARDHHAKTRYIMPPVNFHGGDAARAEEHWDNARLPAIPRGIDLPRYDPRGAQLILDANGRVAETLRL